MHLSDDELNSARVHVERAARCVERAAAQVAKGELPRAELDQAREDLRRVLDMLLTRGLFT